MKATKRLLFLAVLVAFTACTDGPFAPWMDITPPRGGWLWVAKNSSHSGIYKVDVSTGKHVDSLSAPIPKDWLGRNLGLAFGDGKLWVGLAEAGGEFDPSEYYYCWIDPVTGETGDWVKADISVGGLAWDGTRLWTAGGGPVHRIDPDTGEIEYRFSLPYYITGLTWDGSYLWAVSYRESDDTCMRKIDPETGEVVHRIPNPCEGATGLAWDGEALWVNDGKNAVVYRVSPDTGAVLGYFPYDFAPCPWGLAWEFPDGTGN
jgi:hypothetical protein